MPYRPNIYSTREQWANRITTLPRSREAKTFNTITKVYCYMLEPGRYVSPETPETVA
jgi:hypothetical protein